MKPSTSINKCLALSEKPCRLSKPLISPAMTARRALLKRIQRQELKKLQSLLPTLSNRRRQSQNRQKIDALAIVEEACRYIDQLHATILARVHSGRLSQDVVQRLNVNAMLRSQQRTSRSDPAVLREANSNVDAQKKFC